MSYHLKRSDTSVADGARRIAISQIDKALAELDDGTLDVHETVHQVRKRCKKLRGLARLMRPVFGAYKKENAAFRDAASELSHVRDAQAMIETCDNLVAAYDNTIERGTFRSLRSGLAERKERVAREEGLDATLSAFRRAMVEARGRAELWTFDGDGFDAVGGGVAKTYKRGRKAIARARAKPSAGNLHELRKRVKYHRYHADLLRAIWPDLLEPHRDAADDLGDILGQHHNLALLAPVLLSEPESFGGTETVEAFVALIERRQTELEADAFAAGLRLFAEKPSALSRRWAVYWQVWREEKALRNEILGH